MHNLRFLALQTPKISREDPQTETQRERHTETQREIQAWKSAPHIIPQLDQSPSAVASILLLPSSRCLIQVVFGTCLQISCVAPCPRSVWWFCLSNIKARFSKLFSSTRLWTVWPPLVRRFPVSSSSTLHPFVTYPSSRRTTWSFWLNRRLTFRWLSTLCTLGVFAGTSLLVSVPPSQPPWSLVLSAVAPTAVCILGVPPPLVQQYRYLGVVFLSPSLDVLTWTPSVLPGIASTTR